jgi:hypothetical protein
MLQQQRGVLHACRRKVLMNVCNIIFMPITLRVPLTGIGASHVDETVVTHDHSCAYEPLPAASCNHHEPRSNATRAATTNQDGTVPTTWRRIKRFVTICDPRKSRGVTTETRERADLLLFQVTSTMQAGPMQKSAHHGPAPGYTKRPMLNVNDCSAYAEYR